MNNMLNIWNYFSDWVL